MPNSKGLLPFEEKAENLSIYFAMVAARNRKNYRNIESFRETTGEGRKRKARRGGNGRPQYRSAHGRRTHPSKAKPCNPLVQGKLYFCLVRPFVFLLSPAAADRPTGGNPTCLAMGVRVFGTSCRAREPELGHKKHYCRQISWALETEINVGGGTRNRKGLTESLFFLFVDSSVWTMRNATFPLFSFLNRWLLQLKGRRLQKNH